MKRAKDDKRSRASGLAETPQKTAILFGRFESVRMRLSVSELSNTQIFLSAITPQKLNFLISDRMFLLFLAQAVLLACGGGGRGRDYLIGRDNTTDDFVIDLRDDADATRAAAGVKSKTADASRFANADLIHNFDAVGADKDKITVKIDTGFFFGSIRVDDGFNILGEDDRDVTIFEEATNRVLAVVFNVGDVDWTDIIFVNENGDALVRISEATLPDIA